MGGVDTIGLLEVIPVPALILDRTGQVEGANSAAERLLSREGEPPSADALLASLNSNGSTSVRVFERQLEDGRRLLLLVEEPDRARLEAELSEARRVADVLLHSPLDAVIKVDHRGNVIDFNPVAERIFGRKHDEVIGKELAEMIIPPRYREAHRTALQAAVETGGGALLGVPFELPGLRSDGSEVELEILITRAD